MSSDPSPQVTQPASILSREPKEAASGDSAPKKQAIVVYEGDERWQAPRHAGFAVEEGEGSDDEQDDDASTASGSETVAHGDLLAGYSSDSEVRLAAGYPRTCA